MNILAYEEIQKVEESILALYQRQGSPLNLPSQNDLLNLKNFQNQLFKQTSLKTRALLQKNLLIEDELISVSTTEENGVIKIFIYNLLAVIYSPSVNNFNSHILQKRNLDLLNNFKCSIYCKDIKFSLILNPKVRVEKDQQGQILIAYFFKFMENFQKTEAYVSTTLNCIEWLLQHNPLLLQIFILFVRFILMKLEFQDAEDYRSVLKPYQAIINLLQYFDLSYKQAEGLIMFYEQGYFLTIVQKQIVFGKQNSKGLEDAQFTTSSQKLIAVSNHSMKSLSQATKKTENSNKIANHFLTSSCQSQSYQNSLFDKKQETPHFQPNNHFSFQRRRQEENDQLKEKQLKKQLAKVILNYDYSPENDIKTEKLSGYNDMSTPPTPTWCEQFCFLRQKNAQKQFRSTIELSSNIMFRRKNIGSIKEVDENLQKAKKYQNNQKKLQNIKNLVKVVDRGSLKAQKINYEKLASVCDKNLELLSEHNQSIRIQFSEQIQNASKLDFNFHKCACRPFRLVKNSCFSKVMQFCFEPQKSNQKEKKENHPSFFNNKSTVHSYKVGPFIKITPPKQTKNVHLQTSQARQYRIPAFLKIKKKTEKSTSSKGVKKTVQISKELNIQKKQKIDLAQSFKCHSQIILQPQYHYFKSSNSLKKHYHSNSNHQKCTQQADNLKKFDLNNIQSKLGLDQPEQSMKTSGNYYYPPNYHQKMTKLGQITEKTNSPFRIFAPVQIIAPTVYVHSRNSSEGRVIFNLNKAHSKLETSNNQQMSVPGTSLFNGIQKELNSNRSEIIINSFQQKYQ